MVYPPQLSWPTTTLHGHKLVRATGNCEASWQGLPVQSPAQNKLEPRCFPLMLLKVTLITKFQYACTRTLMAQEKGKLLVVRTWLINLSNRLSAVSSFSPRIVASSCKWHLAPLKPWRIQAHFRSQMNLLRFQLILPMTHHDRTVDMHQTTHTNLRLALLLA